MPKRRRKPDFWVKTSWWLASLAPVLAFVALAYADSARPNWRAIGLDDYFGVTRRPGWDESALAASLVMMAVAFALACGSMAIRSRRVKRKEDRIPWATATITSMIGVSLLVLLNIYLS